MSSSCLYTAQGQLVCGKGKAAATQPAPSVEPFWASQERKDAQGVEGFWQAREEASAAQKLGAFKEDSKEQKVPEGFCSGSCSMMMPR